MYVYFSLTLLQYYYYLFFFSVIIARFFGSCLLLSCVSLQALVITGNNILSVPHRVASRAIAERLLIPSLRERSDSARALP